MESRKMFTRGIAALAAASLVVVAGVEGARYWKQGRFIESTDDAYVHADSTIVAPKVSGYIASVVVNDNQSVKAGQLLAHIDDRDLRTALDRSPAPRQRRPRMQSAKRREAREGRRLCDSCIVFS